MRGRWHAPEHLVCTRCGRQREAHQLDRILWCDDCRRAARRHAALWGRLSAVAAAVALILWITFAVRPSNRFLGAWAGIVVAAYWLGSRAAREVIFGITRITSRPRGNAGLEVLPGTQEAGPADTEEEWRDGPGTAAGSG
ncbi:MAG: hypothetical protein HY704_05270 [Gemmatimonadetes bacterium]|nr:hypothetical protein [Gemmatimonadota bacterium]